MEHIVNQTVQVIQSRNFETVMVTQCHIKVTRVIAHCGQGHHSSLVKGAMKAFTYALGSAACQKAHRRFYIEYQGQVVNDLKINATTNIQLTIAGSVDHDGYCKGAVHREDGQVYTDIVAHANLEITLTEFMAYVRVDGISPLVQLKNELVCPYDVGYCFDCKSGDSVWNPKAIESCNQNSHDVLYEGKAETLSTRDKYNTKNVTYVMVNEGTYVFAIELKQEIPLSFQRLSN